MGNVTKDNYLKKELYELIKTDESIFDFIQESSLDGLWYWDLENPENEWMNPKFWTVLGYNPDEMPHKASAWQNIINKDDLKLATENFKKHCENPNHPYDQIVRYTHKNGSTVWLHCRGLATRDTSGKPIRMLGAHHNITNEKKSEQELIYKNKELLKAKEKAEESEARYNLISNNSLDSIWLMDNDLRFTYLSPSTEKLFGYTLIEWETLDWNVFVAPGYMETVLNAFGELKSGFTKEINSLAVIVSHKNGTEMWVEFSANAILNNNNVFTGAVGITRDITQRKQIEIELAESSERFKALHNSSFGGIVIHDKGLIMECNQGLSQITGFSYDELIGMDGLLLIAPETRDMVLSNILAGYEKPYEAMGVRKNGEIYPLRLEARNIPYKGKQVRTVEFRDITETKQAYEALRRSESLKNTMVSNIGDVIVIIDQNGINRFKSQNITKLFGWYPEELIGKSIWDNVHPDNLEETQKFFGAIATRPNSTGTTKLRYKCKDGSYVWIEITVTNLFHDKDIQGVLGNFHEITDRKRFETELIISKENTEKSEEKWRQLFENSMDGIVIVDPDGKFTNCNKSYEKITGYTVNELKALNFYDITPKKYHQWEKTEMIEGQVLKRGYSDRYEKEYIKKDGTLVPIELTAHSVKSTDGKPEYIWGVIRNISERKKYEKDIINAKEKAEESDRLKTAFLQNMSHEIRTPMNAIMGFSGLLARNFNNKEKLENFSKIIDQRCNDLLKIINDILDISKIESGQNSINLEPCNINELFDEIDVFFNDYKSRLNKQHINLFFQSPEGSFANIKTDKLKLKQVLINLITNALKFTETGSINCICKPEGDKLLFQISDTGIGIPSDKIDYIFERFSQIKQTTIQNIGGTGLGLPIVKGLVKLLGGRVWLESECNKGTTFYFTIEYISVDMIPDAALHTEFKLEFNTNKTILIVEDDIYNAEYLNEILKDVTSNIITVVNGLSAVKIVHEQMIDLVLMDIRLPDISGYEVTQLILRDKPKIKIIAQTAYASNTEHQKAIEAGCVDYISKPTKLEELLIMLKKYLT